jgi:hypothetical protein
VAADASDWLQAFTAGHSATRPSSTIGTSDSKTWAGIRSGSQPAKVCTEAMSAGELMIATKVRQGKMEEYQDRISELK